MTQSGRYFRKKPVVIEAHQVPVDTVHHRARAYARELGEWCYAEVHDDGSLLIEWATHTWNPVTGCSKVSPGCAHCYAETLALTRLAGKAGYPGLPWTPENADENVVLRPGRLDQPLRWRKPRLVFVNSMSDLFHELIPDRFIANVFAAMAAAPQHTFQVLTKRPERMRAWFAWEGDSINRCGTVRNEFDFAGYADRLRDPMSRLFDWPLPNVWLGTSIENRRYVGRADDLRAGRSAVHQRRAAARTADADRLSPKR